MSDPNDLDFTAILTSGKTFTARVAWENEVGEGSFSDASAQFTVGAASGGGATNDPTATMALTSTFSPGDSIAANSQVFPAEPGTYVVNVTGNLAAAPVGDIIENGADIGLLFTKLAGGLLFRCGDGQDAYGTTARHAYVFVANAQIPTVPGRFILSFTPGANTVAMSFFNPGNNTLTALGTPVDRTDGVDNWTGNGGGGYLVTSAFVPADGAGTPTDANLFDNLEYFRNQLPA